MKKTLLLTFVLLFLSSCGQKGDLYLEKSTFSFDSPKVKINYNASSK